MQRIISDREYFHHGGVMAMLQHEDSLGFYSNQESLLNKFFCFSLRHW